MAQQGLIGATWPVIGPHFQQSSRSGPWGGHQNHYRVNPQPFASSLQGRWVGVRDGCLQSQTVSLKGQNNLAQLSMELDSLKKRIINGNQGPSGAS